VIDRMRGPRGKIERAKQHVRELEAAISTFLETHPYEVVRDDDTEPGKRLYKLSKADCPPDNLALIAGDIVHNLRAALDLLIWQLIEASGKVPNGHDGFPISVSAQHFETTGIAKVKRRIRKEAVEVLRSVKPYKGGNDALWRLHHLDIADKHHVLYVVGSAFNSVSPGGDASASFPEEVRALMEGVMSQVFLRPADRMFPLKIGDVLFVDAGGRPPAKNQPKFVFDIAFGQGEIVEGEPIVPTLHQLVGATAQTVELFATFLDP
jgi:hypothetical protein